MPKKTSGEGTVSSEVQGDMDNLEQTVGKIEKYLEPFFKTSLKETKNNLSGLEVAKLNIVIAYAINTLFYMYLKTQGVSPNEHPVRTELERVRLYIKKVKELTDKENPQKPTLKLNAEAAQRFINHALNDIMVDSNNNEKENKEPENDRNKKENKGKSKEDQKDKQKNKSKEETPKNNKRQSPDKVTENTDKKKRRK